MVGLCLGWQALAPALDVPSAIGATPARQQAVPAAVAFTADGRIIPPRDYRDWAFLTSGLDMNYADAGAAGQPHMFDNVFVNRAALAVFRKTGQWPEGTVLVKESREGLTKGSINKAGQFQADPVADLEMHVKETRRLGGWGFFSIEGAKPAAMRPKTDDCYTCHGAHGAVDSTFVQFYPTLAPIARQYATAHPQQEHLP